MSKKGPPKFFDNKPKAPANVPLPSAKRRRPPGGEGGGGEGGARPRRPVATGTSQAKAGGGIFGGGESWKTYTVVIVSLVVLAGVAFTYVSRSFKAMDKGKGVAQMGLLAATIEAVDSDLGGFRLAPAMQNDAAVLAILRDVAAGGDVARNEKGEIIGSTTAQAAAARLFVERIPNRCVTGESFHFVFPTPAAAADTPPAADAGADHEAKTSDDTGTENETTTSDKEQPAPDTQPALARTGATPQSAVDEEIAADGAIPPADSKAASLPSIQVNGLGTIRPPAGKDDRWVFDGDLSQVPRASEAGGELVPVSIKKGNGEIISLEIFKPREAKEEPPAKDSY